MYRLWTQGERKASAADLRCIAHRPGTDRAGSVVAGGTGSKRDGHLAHERVARSLQLGYGLTVSRSGICRALERFGNLAAPTYDRLKASLRRSPFNGLDDTGWRVGGQLQNCRVIGNESVTVYLIEPHRGFAEAAAVYWGPIMIAFWCMTEPGPGTVSCRLFTKPASRIRIRRCRDLLKFLTGKAQQFPQAVLELLLDSLHLRDRREQGLVGEHGLAVAAGRLEARLDRLLATTLCHTANQRFARHLQHEQPHLFTFIYLPGIPATNNFIEAAIRLMVVAPQNLGRQPDLERRSNPTDFDRRFAHLLATGQRCFSAVGYPTAFSAADSARSRSSFSISLTPLFSSHLSNYSLSTMSGLTTPC